MAELPAHEMTPWNRRSLTIPPDSRQAWVRLAVLAALSQERNSSTGSQETVWVPIRIVHEPPEQRQVVTSVWIGPPRAPLTG